ncbi:UDP-4-amino-4,6-dideoxy-N-acetyl-beta-L-altrosamine N-acetyltransferase [Ectopseudomonas mendocina]|nr:UDP-4-amino-4,6-dideoxy-N-acetyl-beta-L-altrosamine N-acetyltransferase [Pseudomonas mendocina]TRO28772.1 UDP-4-amino-4,6-dideoxy-N-acetyl-beta-L-altrosamine N-acetyltransferase [Pseudomonas mendocina]
MKEEDLACVLAWRNHPDVRRFMYTQHEITPLEHMRWFENSQLNTARNLLIFEAYSVPMGFININQTLPGHVADWGFYLDPAAPRGMGHKLGAAALEFAFATLGLHKICGQALVFNERSIRFHLRLGFQQEGELRDQYYDGKCYHSVIHFGLLSGEWQTQS